MASRGVNQATLIGNLGQDPEIRHTADGRAIANLSIATSEVWKDKATGEKKEQTEWHRCVAFGPLASVIENYLKKGSKVYIQGSIHTRKWQGDDGQDKYTTEIKIRDMQMLGDHGSARENNAYEGGFRTEAAQTPRAQPQAHPAATAPAPAAQVDAFAEDDIPF